MSPETAIIIRCRNEERWIGETLTRLSGQTYQNFEIILVDSGSTDETLSIAKVHPVKVVSIKPEEFTYPFAINVGIKNSTAKKYLVILSAHSLPINKHWLEKGINNFSSQPNVLGVYGPVKPLPGSTIWDKLFHYTSYLISAGRMFPGRSAVIEKDGMGTLGFTNAIIRKDLWDTYPINESYAAGGEDGDWMRHFLTKGYVAIKDLDFTVLHSHNLDFVSWKKQLQHWGEVSSPLPFTHLSFRKDSAHTPIKTDKLF